MPRHSALDLDRVLPQFAIEGEPLRKEPLRRGHIHDTFVSTWHTPDGERRYLHQRMNEAVFEDIDALMHNVERVTRHLRDVPAGSGTAAPDTALPDTGPPDTTLESLQLVPTRDGRPFLRWAGFPWRTYHFIDGAESYDRPRTPRMAREAARAFGDFQARLATLPMDELRETIPRFFSSPYRLEQLDDARDRAHARGLAGRVALVAAELAFIDERRELVPLMEDRIADGRIPRRVVHGDTKLNNVLFDKRSGQPRCIVDLDTCMPGYSLYDFGDLVRFTAAKTGEDERDLSKVGVDIALYETLVEGYLAGTGDSLGDEERQLMPEAARLVTMTIGMRFLADYLAGDVYFKTSYDEHNLVRARVQLQMVAELERRLPSMTS